MSLGHDGPPTTRTRLPEGQAGPGGTGGRRPSRSSRNLVTVVGVIVLLIAAIAFANRGGGSDGSTGSGSTGSSGSGKDTTQSQPTAATGQKPVSGSDQGIASGFAKTSQGAQSAAANYAVALVSADILKPEARHAIVERLFTTAQAPALQSKLDSAYSTAFLARLGLDENGEAASGMTYISRTTPVGTKATSYGGNTATVEVWCTGVFGTAGEGSTNPVANDWFTMTLNLRWTTGDWKVESFSQKEGPAPVNSDVTASSADEIAKAVEEYGGFTYAR